MKFNKVSYSSSLGIQVAAVNFSVKYRHAIFKDNKVKMKVIESFRETEQIYNKETGLRILELGVDRDHAHLVLQWGPAKSISEIMKLIKGRSAREVLEAFPKLRSKKFWGGHMWSPAYYFLTTGTADLNHHLEYVKNQGGLKLPIPNVGQMKLDAYVA